MSSAGASSPVWINRISELKEPELSGLHCKYYWNQFFTENFSVLRQHFLSYIEKHQWVMDEWAGGNKYDPSLLQTGTDCKIKKIKRKNALKTDECFSSISVKELH